MFFVPQPFLRFLSRFDPALEQVLGPGGPLSPFKAYGGEASKEKRRRGEPPTRPCSRSSGAASVTLQPAALSAAALRRVASGVRRGAITRSCAAFNSTHDAGLSLFLWQVGRWVGG